MLLRRSTDIYPKELARDMREFFNSLLGDVGAKQSLPRLPSSEFFGYEPERHARHCAPRRRRSRRG